MKFKAMERVMSVKDENKHVTVPTENKPVTLIIFMQWRESHVFELTHPSVWGLDISAHPVEQC